MTKEEALKTYFGYDAFRGGQEAVIDALFSGRDALAIMPTGAGKSVCYQIPALLLPGITLVISPLVSLMRDQVTALVQMGVPAAFLNSSLTFRQYLLALDRAKEGRYKIIYAAPERLETESFRSFAQAADISLVAVDEAHCISQWGQDFRPSYLNIPAFVASLPKRPPVGAFTATATPDVKADIENLLALRDPLRAATGFDRENLYFEVRQPSDKKAALLELVKSRPGKCGIVYCATRKAVEEVCRFLRDRGIDAARYHAGLEPEERRQSQEDFLYDRAQVMVATNAFGMGIDKCGMWSTTTCPRTWRATTRRRAGRAGTDCPPPACCCTAARTCGRANTSSPTLRPGRTWTAPRRSGCGSGTSSGCGRWPLTAIPVTVCASTSCGTSARTPRTTAAAATAASTILRRWRWAGRPGPSSGAWRRQGSASARGPS